MPEYERIVSLAPSNTEILYELGVGDRVVATTDLCDYPEPATEMPSVGGWTNPDIDAVQEHNPDLVLASDELQDAAVDTCRDAGLTVKQFTPTTLHGVFNTIKSLGELVGAEDDAYERVTELNERIRGLAMMPAEHRRPRIYCEEWHDPPMIAGNWIPRIASLLGGEYILAEGERSRKVAVEELHMFDPTHIFVHLCGFGDDAESSMITGREDWQRLSAVRDGNVYVIDDALLNRPGPRLVEGMWEMKKHVKNS